MSAQKGGPTLRVWPGKPYPLGATWDAAGVNFALFGENAEKVELCLFDSVDATEESHRITLTEKTNQVWHAYLPDVRPGQLYGYRVHGPYDPEQGLRFNAHKILLDPYAKTIGRDLTWDDSLFGYEIGHEDEDLSKDERDSAAVAPLAMVIDPAFTWGDDRPPKTPWSETVIYETHVKGFTKTHPGIKEDWRGTYAGMSSEPAIEHLKKLGVTAVELMPVHYFINDRHLQDVGRSNYWGYNTLGFFAPHRSYAAATDARDAVWEFKTMVRTLHGAGIEVILDVVYNHTAEGQQLGPTLSFRGIDNGAYYRLVPDQPRYHVDFTGCGNTLNMMSPRVLQLIMDSLRYWVQEMHVDGFRFDLASALARELFAVDRLGAFFDIIQQDPVLSQVKLIAEPWDLGEGGYQVGNFPVLWTEWNGKYRDTVRSFWRGDDGAMSNFATRICGSSDLYESSGRRPYASINFVTCHDGFTLRDLASYNEKHNEANGEDNRDGCDDNISMNFGVEGHTTDEAINSERLKQCRNFIATMMMSQGVPMLSGGDELGRTQNGNNNVYGHDDELSWYSWDLREVDRELIQFTSEIIAFRKAHPLTRRRHFFQGRRFRGAEARDVVWLETDGSELSEDAWEQDHRKAFGARWEGQLGEHDQVGRPIEDDTLLTLFNAHSDVVTFTLPGRGPEIGWQRAFDTWSGFANSLQTSTAEEAKEIGGTFELRGRSMAVFVAVLPKPTESNDPEQPASV